jgi:CRP-like cAMP-binding protein
MEAWRSSPSLFRSLAACDWAGVSIHQPAVAEDRVFQYLAGFVCANPGKPMVLELPLTHQQMAERLGLSRETVSRAIGRLMDAGRVKRVGRHTYEILAQ